MLRTSTQPSLRLPARTLGALLQDFSVVHVRASDIATGEWVGGVLMVATDRKLRGCVVCSLPVLEDVRTAVHALAVARAPAPAPAPAPVPVPVPAALAAQEDLAGAAPCTRGCCGATRQEAQGTRRVGFLVCTVFCAHIFVRACLQFDIHMYIGGEWLPSAATSSHGRMRRPWTCHDSGSRLADRRRAASQPASPWTRQTACALAQRHPRPVECR